MYSAESDIKQMFQERKYNKKVLIEAKLGSIILKDPGLIDNFEVNDDELVNVQTKINKHQYKFESAISKQDFSKVKKSYPNKGTTQECSLDLTIELSKYVKLCYRIVQDKLGKIFCYEKFKEQKQQHMDVIDQGRVYRVSSTEQNLQHYPQSDVFIDKIRDSIRQSEKGVQCVRYKQNRLQIDDGLSEKLIYEVEQVENRKKSIDFINQIVELLIDDNNPLRTNLQLIFNLLQSKANYYKPHFEAEIRIAQNRNVNHSEFIQMIRDFHDSVIMNNNNLIKTEGESTKNVRRINAIQKHFNNNNKYKGQKQLVLGNQLVIGKQRTRGQQRNQNQQDRQQVQQIQKPKQYQQQYNQYEDKVDSDCESWQKDIQDQLEADNYNGSGYDYYDFYD